jgi:HAD superfamily hydrolase (TIGR01509 family)
MISLIIFDLDGVLAETENMHFGTLCRSINSITGVPISDIQQIIKIDGSTTKDKLRLLRSIYGWSDDVVQSIDKLKQESVVDELKTLSATQQQIEMLTTLRSNYKLVIGSNARKNSVDVIIDSMKIRDFFDYIVSIDDIGIAKPNPAIYNYIMKLMNTNPHNTIIIEDSPRGIEAAIASNANVLITKSVEGTTLEFIENALRQYNADYNSSDGGNRL